MPVQLFYSCFKPNRLPRSYHSGETGDLDWVVRSLARTDRPVSAVVGFSLGGNQLLKWLGEQGADAPVRKAVAVSVPSCWPTPPGAWSKACRACINATCCADCAPATDASSPSYPHP